LTLTRSAASSTLQDSTNNKQQQAASSNTTGSSSSTHHHQQQQQLSQGSALGVAIHRHRIDASMRLCWNRLQELQAAALNRART
jgi:hypothetical protein